MFSRKTTKKAPRLVWRMTESNPAGEFVPSESPARHINNSHEIHERGLRESAKELADGAEVTETDISTLPGELADEFLKSEVL